MKPRGEPVVALPLVEHYLQRAQPDDDEAEADVVDADRASARAHPRRVLDQPLGQQQRHDADRDVDEEDPAPAEVVGDVAAQRRADGRRQHHRHAVDGERHAALLRRKGVGQDRLLARLQPAAAGALQDAADDERAQVGRQAAQERADGEQRHADHVEALAPDHRRQPAARPAGRWRWTRGTRSGPRCSRRWPTDRLPAMCGSETLAMLVSSTSMNVASVTVMAIAQGCGAAAPRARALIAAGRSARPTCPGAGDGADPDWARCGCARAGAAPP